MVKVYIFVKSLASCNFTKKKFADTMNFIAVTYSALYFITLTKYNRNSVGSGGSGVVGRCVGCKILHYDKKMRFEKLETC